MSINGYNNSNGGSSYSGLSNTNYAASSVELFSGAGGNGGMILFKTAVDVNTAPTEKVRITKNGQIIISQIGNTFSDGFRIQNTSSQYWGFVAGGDSNLYLGYNSPSTSIGVFSSSTGIYTPLSDFNKKKDFEASKIGLKEILQLKPTLYRMKSDKTESSKELGFIAQEVKEFIPQAYSESINGDETFIGLNYNGIVAALVKAVQEQQSQIESLKNQLN
jgi:hypothetical protein